jgi:molybdopterin converting factor small subunit
MQVLIPSPLHGYTGSARVQARGATLGALLEDLDRQFPGIRFRIIDEQGRMRPHMRFFINQVAVFELDEVLRETDEVVIVQALSGG